MCVVSDVCDYIYISGLRFKSGTPFIEIPAWYLDVLTDKPATDRSKAVRLSVVRDGKGASRTERWALKPSKFGVVGEINLRDLKRVMSANNEISIEALIPIGEDGAQSLVSLTLDPYSGMGRGGRVLNQEAVEGALESVPDDLCQALLLNQLENMPYGLENSRAAAARLRLILKYADMKTLAESVDAGHVDFVKHMSREVVKSTPELVVVSVLAELERHRDQSLQHEEAWCVLSARIWEMDLENSLKHPVPDPSKYGDFPLGYLPDVRWRHQVDEGFVVSLCLARMRQALGVKGGKGYLGDMVWRWREIIVDRENMATLYAALSDMLPKDVPVGGELMSADLARRYAGHPGELERIAKRHSGRMLGRVAEAALSAIQPTGKYSTQAGQRDQYEDLSAEEIMDL